MHPPHGDFHQSPAFHLPGQCEYFSPLRAGRPTRLEGGCAVQDDPRDVGQRLHVVNAGGVAPQPRLDREGWPDPRHAALPLDGGDEGSLLSAHEGACALLQGDLEVEPFAQNVGAQESVPGRLGDRVPEPSHGLRVFRADVHIPGVSADGIRCNGHPFQDRVGIALQHAAVHECPRIPFVPIADDVLVCVFGRLGQPPLRASREARTAPSAQAGIGNDGDNLRGRHLDEDLLQRAIAIPRLVLIQAGGIDYTAVSEDDAPLPGEDLARLDYPLVDDLALAQMLRDDPVRPLGRDLAVQGLSSLMVPDLDQDLPIAQTNAAGLLEDRVIGVGVEQLGKALVDPLAPGSDPAGAKPYHDFLHGSLLRDSQAWLWMPLDLTSSSRVSPPAGGTGGGLAAPFVGSFARRSDRRPSGLGRGCNIRGRPPR